MNKVNTKVEARFNVQAATWLPEYKIQVLRVTA